MENMQTSDKKVCKCPHHSVMPWAVILIGIVIILSATNVLNAMQTWLIVGILLVVIGGIKLLGRKCACC